MDAIPDDAFGHRWIATPRLLMLLTVILGQIEGDTVVTVSSVTGNLLIHAATPGGEPGEMLAVVNLATERVEWRDSEADE